MKLRISLETKICVLVGCLLFGLLLAVGNVHMSRYRSNLVMEKISEYQALSGMLALVYSPLGTKADLAQYRDFTSRFMESDPDIAYVVIADAQGKVLFANTRKLDPDRKGLAGSPLNKVLALLRWSSGKDSDKCTMFRVPTTVRPGERGTITVGFASRSIDASVESMQTDLLCTFGFALLVGLFAAVLIAKAVTLPLKQLIRAAGEVASGNLDFRVMKASDDEIGDLIDNFNSMVHSLKISQDKLIERANTDSLTGLRNHRYFQERLRSELKRAERYGRPLSVIMLDIDDFKILNDTHGHPVGDSVLQDVAEILLRGARNDIDVVCRYGGEEFAVILPETSSSDALAVAERIRESVAKNGFTGKDGVDVNVTISLGIAEYPLHSSEREGLIMAADLALYQSKSVGKNRTTVFSNDTRTDRERDPYRLHLLVNATDITTVEALAMAVDTKGRRGPECSKAIVEHAVSVAKSLGMTEMEQRDVKIASLLRDIGKLGVSSNVLNKSEPLTSEELDMVHSHPTLGYSVVQKSPHLKSMLPGILYHHERWDGKGYPKGLKGEEIPLIARIIAVVDAYHAMVTQRPHSGAKSVEEATAEIRRGAGTQFDPRVVGTFLQILTEEDASKKAA